MNNAVSLTLAGSRLNISKSDLRGVIPTHYGGRKWSA